ncbi:MAG TPA: TonB family protein [Oculatellaceae cyanobacterium]
MDESSESEKFDASKQANESRVFSLKEKEDIVVHLKDHTCHEVALVKDIAEQNSDNGVPSQDSTPSSANEALSNTPKIEPTGATKPAESEVPPTLATYGKKVRYSRQELQHLLSVVGDHSAPETSWMRACHLLGDYKHQPKRPPSRPSLILLAVLLTSGTVCFVFFNFLDSMCKQIHPTPCPLPVATDQSTAPSYGAYMVDMQRRIKRSWFPPRGGESTQVVVAFKIANDGSLLSSKIHKSSGSAAADHAAMVAVSNAAPYRHLPDATKSVDVEFTFDYNMFTAHHKGQTEYTPEYAPTVINDHNADHFSTESMPSQPSRDLPPGGKPLPSGGTELPSSGTELPSGGTELPEGGTELTSQ